MIALHFNTQAIMTMRTLYVFLFLCATLLSSCTPINSSTTQMNLPAWVENVPVDEDYYYTVGTGLSQDRARARDKARFNGEIAIAKVIGERVVGLEASLLETIPSELSGTSQTYFKEVKKSVENQRLSEVTITEIHFQWVDKNSMVRCYILTRIPISVAHQLIKTTTERVFLNQPELWNTISSSDPFKKL